MALGNQQQVARVRTHPLDRVAGGLNRGRQHFVGQVVESAREQVHVDRRQLVAGVAQVDRAVERRCVVQPLQPEPALDRRQRVEDALLEIQQGAGLGGHKVGNGGKRHFELACGARADPPRAGAIGTGSLACTLAGRIGVRTRVLGGRGGAVSTLGRSRSSGLEWGAPEAWGVGSLRGRAAASGARPGLIRGGRRFAPTSLCCSARGRAAGLAACAARTPLKHAAASQTRSALARADLGPALLAAPEIGPAAPRWPLHYCMHETVFPSPPGGEGLGRSAPLLPPGGRPGGCRSLWDSVERPAAPKLGRLTQARAQRAWQSECTCDPEGVAYTRTTQKKRAPEGAR